LVLRKNLIPFPVKVSIPALMFPGMGRYQFIPGIASCDTSIEPKWIVVVKINIQFIGKTSIFVNFLSDIVRKTKQDGVGVLGGQVLRVRGDVPQD
jgi:hypothetical protein